MTKQIFIDPSGNLVDQNNKSVVKKKANRKSQTYNVYIDDTFQIMTAQAIGEKSIKHLQKLSKELLYDHNNAIQDLYNLARSMGAKITLSSPQNEFCHVFSFKDPHQSHSFFKEAKRLNSNIGTLRPTSDKIAKYFYLTRLMFEGNGYYYIADRITKIANKYGKYEEIQNLPPQLRGVGGFIFYEFDTKHEAIEFAHEIFDTLPFIEQVTIEDYFTAKSNGEEIYKRTRIVESGDAPTDDSEFDYLGGEDFDDE